LGQQNILLKDIRDDQRNETIFTIQGV